MRDTDFRDRENRPAGWTNQEKGRREHEYRSGSGSGRSRSYRDNEYRSGGRNGESRNYRDNEYRSGSGSGRSRNYRDNEHRSGSESRSYRENEYRPGNGRSQNRDYRDNEHRSGSGEGRNYTDYEYRPAERENAGQEDYTDNILTGRNPIREALKSGRDIEKLLVQKGELSGSAREIVATAREKNIMVQAVDRSRLDQIAPNHQGLIAFASAYSYSDVDEILKTAEERGEAPFIVILDGITDPHNLGAVIRTAECAGAHGVIVPQHRSVGLTPAAVKASAGAVEYIKVARVTNINRTIEDLQKRNIWVYAASMDGEDFEETDLSGSVALVIGAEGEGISRLTEEKCDGRISLPMKGHLDSLNASVAAGILMYRVLSCRRKG